MADKVILQAEPLPAAQKAQKDAGPYMDGRLYNVGKMYNKQETKCDFLGGKQSAKLWQ